MSVKRLAEYRFIKKERGEEAAGFYRSSFVFYSEVNLLVSSFVYAMLSAFGTGVFLIKYREEYILSFPIFIALFSYYLYLGLQDVSVTQTPEKLHKDLVLVAILIVLVASMLTLTFIDVEVTRTLLKAKYTPMD